MAKVLIEFDTVDKTMTASLDGTAVENCVGAYLGRSYNDDQSYCCELMTSATNKEHDYKVVQRIVASDTPAGQDPKAKPSAFKDFKVVDIKSQTPPKMDPALAEEINKFLSRE